MANANRSVLNLDLDLLRTFVVVADLNTFAAAVAVCRTQSAVSQQMQRLEQLVGKELFAHHGRNKLLTEHGVQFLSYARKILQFNDEACTSPTMWYCAADYRFRQDEPVSLVLLDEPSNFRALAITLLNEAGIPSVLPMSRLRSQPCVLR